LNDIKSDVNDGIRVLPHNRKNADMLMKNFILKTSVTPRNDATTQRNSKAYKEININQSGE